MATTQEALESWRDLFGRFSEEWAEHLRDKETFKDLPPDIAQKIITASRVFADVGNTVKDAHELSTRMLCLHDPNSVDIDHLDFEIE